MDEEGPRRKVKKGEKGEKRWKKVEKGQHLREKRGHFGSSHFGSRVRVPAMSEGCW